MENDVAASLQRIRLRENFSDFFNFCGISGRELDFVIIPNIGMYLLYI